MFKWHFGNKLHYQPTAPDTQKVQCFEYTPVIKAAHVNPFRNLDNILYSKKQHVFMHDYFKGFNLRI